VKKITVNELFNSINKSNLFTKITNEQTFLSVITNPYVSRPSLALTGYLERFSYDRVQVLGDPEIGYLQNLSDEQTYFIMKKILNYKIPCFVISKGNSLPEFVIYLANEANIPIFQTAIPTDDLLKILTKTLNEKFAPYTVEHSTFVDVYGVGVLLTGKSGVGKSESALDLVDRGHRLICDDTTKILLNRQGILIGSSLRNQGSFMEIRGVGIINVEKMFGVRSIKKSKSISMVIEFIPYDPDRNYDTINTERMDNKKFKNYLDVNIPLFQLPVSPGKNMSVIIETAILNFLLINNGYNSAKIYMKKQLQFLKKK